MESAMDHSSESEDGKAKKRSSSNHELSYESITETPEEREKREKEQLAKHADSMCSDMEYLMEKIPRTR
jgi:hypothetical protein